MGYPSDDFRDNYLRRNWRPYWQKIIEKALRKSGDHIDAFGSQNKASDSVDNKYFRFPECKYSHRMPFHGHPRILALAGKRTPDGFKIRNSLYCVIDSAAAGDIEIARYVRGHHIYV